MALSGQSNESETTQNNAVNTNNKKTTVLTIHGLPRYEEKIGEEYMSESQRNHFRSILKAWRQELMEEVDRTVNHMQDEAANFPDPADRASQEEEFSKMLSKKTAP